jgi:hypothetical protein
VPQLSLLLLNIVLSPVAFLSNQVLTNSSAFSRHFIVIDDSFEFVYLAISISCIVGIILKRTWRGLCLIKRVVDKVRARR